MIDGRTRLVGLIGWPVAHSGSPAMHNAAFAALKLNWSYVPLPVRPEALAAAVAGLAALGFRGANVTVPHKEAVVPLLDSLSPEAARINAVNTIVVKEDGRLVGHNTDVAGFIAALRQAGFSPEGRSAVVVGAGGAARAAVHALLAAGAARILILNRSGGRAEKLISELGTDERVQVLPLIPEALVESARDADLLVNATPVGLWPKTEESIWPMEVPVPARITVFDLVYNPVETLLLRQAREGGARTIPGLGMLISQGAAAFRLWTGIDPPLDTMRAACVRTLQEKNDG